VERRKIQNADTIMIGISKNSASKNAIFSENFVNNALGKLSKKYSNKDCIKVRAQENKT